MAKIRTTHTHRVRSTQRSVRCSCAPEPRKQGIFSTREHRKSFAHGNACDMLRAESLAAESIFRGIFSNEESSNGKERWRTDEVGNRGNDLQRQRAVPQAGRRGVRVTQRHHQEEPAWPWPVHAARLAEDEGREEARHEGA